MPENIVNNPEQPADLHMDNLVNQIMVDRLKIRDTNADMQNIPLLKVENIPAESQVQIHSNLRLLAQLNGHRGEDLRRLIFESSNDSTVYLQKLYRWSESLEVGQAIAWSGIISEAPPAFLSATQPERLYQGLLFLQKHPDTKEEDFEEKLFSQTVQTLNMLQDKKKWLDIIDEMLVDDSPQLSAQALLREIGFIPIELLDKKRSKNFPPEYILRLIEELRALEHTEISALAIHERAKLSNFLFTSGIANKIRTKANGISLDTNGIFINLKGLHAHIPYGLITPECLVVLKRDNWLNDSELLETNIRTHEENTNISAFQFEQEDQLDAFSSTLGVGQTNQLEVVDSVAEQMVANPEKFARTLYNENLIIPDIFIREIFQGQDKEKMFALFRTAEIISMLISKEELRPDKNAFEGHELSSTTSETYKTRAGILNHPLYYNSLKITREFLNSETTSDPDEKFLVFRGQYKKSPRGNQHSFIEILHDGQLARVLIDEKKHLHTNRLKKLQHIELFERDQYENLENALQTFNYFVSTLDRLQKILSRRSKGWEEKFVQLAETSIHFLLSNVTGHHQSANQTLEIIKYKQQVPDKTYMELLGIFEEAQEQYEKFIYNNLDNVANFTEKFSPEVQKSDVQFGPHFANEAEANTADYGHDKKLCEQETEVRLCVVNHRAKDPSETIPFHIEESCLNALRIDRDRPLINVIGGCKHADGAEDPLEKFSSAVMEVAHATRANVGVPGTQSGIGVSFGWENVKYRQQFGHLPRAEQAHLFSINPGGNTFFPGNKFSRGTDQNHVFANTPVDSIITPFSAGWGEYEGLDKLKSPYLNHVAYMEAFYARMAVNQPKVMVVGNGGLFSVIEIVESLKRDFDLILVKGTGRFADAAALLIENLDDIDLTSDNKNKSLIELIKKLPDDIAKEFLNKDFGKDHDTDDENHQVFREFFWRFVKIAKLKRDRIKTSSLKDLQETLTESL